MITTAFINIWNTRVGAIAWNSETGLGSFEYDTSFLKNNWDLAPITMPIQKAEKKIFTFPELKNETTFKGLPGLLADVLPLTGNLFFDVCRMGPKDSECACAF